MDSLVLTKTLTEIELLCVLPEKSIIKKGFIIECSNTFRYILNSFFLLHSSHIYMQINNMFLANLSIFLMIRIQEGAHHKIDRDWLLQLFFLIILIQVGGTPEPSLQKEEKKF